MVRSGATGQADGGGHRPQVVADDDQVRGVEGDVGRPIRRASPRSAVARAGASLTPSPTMATEAPLGLEPPDHRHLVRRQGPGHDLVDPDGGGHGSATAARCPRSASTQRSPMACSRVHGRERRRAHGVGDGQRPDDLRRRRPTSDRRPARRLPRRRIAPPGRPGATARPRQRARPSPTSTACPSTTPRTPSPGRATNPLDRRRCRPPGRRRRWPGPWGARGRCSTAPAQRAAAFAALDTGDRRHVGDRHPPLGDRPGLVEHHGVDLLGRPRGPGSP